MMQPADKRVLQDYLYAHPWRNFLLNFFLMFAVKRMLDDLMSILTTTHSATNAYFFSLMMACVFMYTQRKTIEKRLDKEARLALKNPNTKTSDR